MKFLGAFLFFFVWASATADPVEKHSEKIMYTQDLLMHQRDLMRLFYHPQKPSIFKDHETIGKEYNIRTNLNMYKNTTAVELFLKRYKTGLVPMGNLFSIMYEDMMHDAESLFRVLYYAKDYDTFYKTACWAKEHVNQQLFTYVLSVAILHHPEMKGISLPPPHETYPHYYFPEDVMHIAYMTKMQGFHEHMESTDHNMVILKSNYTGWYMPYNDEQMMNYFTEDISWNSMYYQYHLSYPFWMNSKEFNLMDHGRGEVYYYLHKQLLTRYYLERLSNGLGEIPTFSWNWPIETGYMPYMKHPNGMSFPMRPNHMDLRTEEHVNQILEIKDYEHRIREAIDAGYMEKADGTHVSLKTPEAIEHVGNLVEANADVVDTSYYQYPMMHQRELLGNSIHPIYKYMVIPSALQSYHSSLRDPMFYQMSKRYLHLMTEFKKKLQPYTVEELLCPGVKIESVDVDKLITHMEYYDSELTNSLYQSKTEIEHYTDDIWIMARQRRLAHKSFTVTTCIQSEKSQDVVVRMFLAPKKDGKGHIIPLEDNWENVVQIDQFKYTLKKGKNTLDRRSKDFYWSSKDCPMTREQYKCITDAIASKCETCEDICHLSVHNSYPSRLILPKGTRGGLPLHLYVVVTPYKMPKVPVDYSMGIGYGTTRLDSHALGYPFDRPVIENHFNLNNIHVEDVIVFHKTESEINSPHHTI